MPQDDGVRRIDRVGVVGSGAMGSGIAEVCAVGGVDVRVAVSRESSLRSAPERFAAALDRRVAKEKLTADERDAAMARISFTTDLGDLADRQLVVEAIPEDEALKVELFATLDKVVEDDAVLASTTSAITITRLARATTRPRRVIGIHFFNPVAAMPLVEVVPTLLTDDSVRRRVEAFLTDRLGKQSIPSGDRSGFVVNALLVPYLVAAVRMVEAGFASAAAVDQGMQLGCGHPMGPLRLCDMVGLDVVAAAADALYREFREPLYAPPPLLSRMVESGLLGRKTGRGFYEYA
ncbi:3-hydroxybutyryl-CoA dehydrogenase [Kitasatospora sp. DSM 101779]|uniref:3-hydroxybutyryl-CoA dehydrogenase n=1 Tax=Kitasatospora sp. DSM 101779 TaxID=2853165 RepID=UPI002953BA2C|nr:3-hydroxybutyryl-CoA dehydrogenase [Kitasatospora sp. DSM 101779]